MAPSNCHKPYPNNHRPHNKERCRSEAAEIWNHLNLRKGVKIFDCPCGRGHISMELARLGAFVVGMDINPGFIINVKKKIETEGLKAFFYVGDMRRACYRGGCDLLLNWFNSFNRVEEEEENIFTMLRFAGCLKAGGTLLMKNLNPKEVCHAAPNREYSGKIPSPYCNYARECSRAIFPSARRHDAQNFTPHIYTLEEYENMFHAAGLRIKGVWGEHFTPYTKFSRNTIIAAEK